MKKKKKSCIICGGKPCWGGIFIPNEGDEAVHYFLCKKCGPPGQEVVDKVEKIILAGPMSGGDIEKTQEEALDDLLDTADQHLRESGGDTGLLCLAFLQNVLMCRAVASRNLATEEWLEEALKRLTASAGDVGLTEAAAKELIERTLRAPKFQEPPG